MKSNRDSCPPADLRKAVRKSKASSALKKRAPTSSSDPPGADLEMPPLSDVLLDSQTPSLSDALLDSQMPAESADALSVVSIKSEKSEKPKKSGPAPLSEHQQYILSLPWNQTEPTNWSCITDADSPYALIPENLLTVQEIRQQLKDWMHIYPPILHGLRCWKLGYLRNPPPSGTWPDSPRKQGGHVTLPPSVLSDQRMAEICGYLGCSTPFKLRLELLLMRIKTFQHALFLKGDEKRVYYRCRARDCINYDHVIISSLEERKERSKCAWFKFPDGKRFLACQHDPICIPPYEFLSIRDDLEGPIQSPFLDFIDEAGGESKAVASRSAYYLLPERWKNTVPDVHSYPPYSDYLRNYHEFPNRTVSMIDKMFEMERQSQQSAASSVEQSAASNVEQSAASNVTRSNVKRQKPSNPFIKPRKPMEKIKKRMIRKYFGRIKVNK